MLPPSDPAPDAGASADDAVMTGERPSGVAARPSGLDAAAIRLIDSIRRGATPEIDPELERFLRGAILARALRQRHVWQERALGLDASDIAQRVFVKLLETPPELDAAGQPLRSLLAWVKVVTQRTLIDLGLRRSERLEGASLSARTPTRRVGAMTPPLRERVQTHVRLQGGTPTNTEARVDAARQLAHARELIARLYPTASPLFDLLLSHPQATSRELAEALDTTSTNVDQMRSRLRRLLRGHLTRDQGGKK